jgi:hypothetical protein
MATPARLTEIECPHCHATKWIIDNDYRGASLVGGVELGYPERTYDCAGCGKSGPGWSVKQQAPAAFLLQPHPVHPMTTPEFARWLAVFRAQFPSDARLRSVGVSWYPGEAGEEQTQRLRDARQIGAVQGYRLSLSNNSPDDERIRVCVQKNLGEAHFWCGPEVELDRCFFGFEPAELEAIRALLAANASDIDRAWQRFSTEAGRARQEWLPRLIGPGKGEDVPGSPPRKPWWKVWG